MTSSGDFVPASFAVPFRWMRSARKSLIHRLIRRSCPSIRCPPLSRTLSCAPGICAAVKRARGRVLYKSSFAETINVGTRTWSSGHSEIIALLSTWIPRTRLDKGRMLLITSVIRARSSSEAFASRAGETPRKRTTAGRAIFIASQKSSTRWTWRGLWPVTGSPRDHLR